MGEGERHRDLQRIDILRERNSDPAWVNSDLYRGYLYRKGLYTRAYEKLKSKPGNVSPGGAAEASDDSSDEVDAIVASLRDESYQPEPPWRVLFPQAGGYARKLGVPGLRDQVLQETVRLVLEAIYEPIFSHASHGFRVGRNPHTALKAIQSTWSDANWFITGNVRGCFRGVNHELLIGIMKEKICDERFLNLVRKFLKCGYVEKEMDTRNSVIGTPRGGVLSPTLTNIYLHKLDIYVDSLQKAYEQGQRQRANPAYQTLADRKELLAQRGETRTREFRDITREMRKLPVLDPYDQSFIRIQYIRYADEWIIGVSGSKKLAEDIQDQVHTFLKEDLKFHLSEGQIGISHARKEHALFLGVQISVGRAAAERNVTLATNVRGRDVERQSTGWDVVMQAPIDRHIKTLSEEGFCDASGKPKAQGAWVNLEADHLIQRYSSINRGMQNYYRFTDNFAEMRRIQYVLTYSLAKTLAEKYKTHVAKVFDKGKIKAKVTHADGSRREVVFYQNRDWHVNRSGFQAGRDIGRLPPGKKRPGVHQSKHVRFARRTIKPGNG